MSTNNNYYFELYYSNSNRTGQTLTAKQAKQGLAALDTLQGYEVYQVEMEQMAEMVGDQVKLKLDRVN